MIISASRRTDIPALYPQWFINRLLAKEVLVPNPYNRKKVQRVSLERDVVDMIVFWTKNPKPMIPYLRMIDMLEYPYYFEVSLTDYGKKMEPNLPSIEERIATFILLSEKLGSERVDFRFDPIILSEEYPASYHVEKFDMMCEWVHKYTDRCIFSFVDKYKGCSFLEPEIEEMQKVAEQLAKIANKYYLPLYTCAEKIDLEQYGIRHASCIDKNKIESLLGYKIDAKRDGSQRKECRCVESVDIGMYDTCIHGCKYCYANGLPENVLKKHAQHDWNSPILIGNLQGEEIITDRKVHSSKDNQLSLFDFM